MSEQCTANNHPVQVILLLPITFFALGKIDRSSTSYDEIEHHEIKRNKAVKMARMALTKIKSGNMRTGMDNMSLEMQVGSTACDLPHLAVPLCVALINADYSCVNLDTVRACDHAVCMYEG